MLDAANAPARSAEPARSRAWRRRLGAALVALAVLGTLVLVRATLVTPVRVASASMLPTYAAGDVVLVSRRPPDLSDIDRGDLVTFRSPEDGHDALKRVIGLPGDSLVILDSELYVNGRHVREPYVNHRLIDAYYSRTYRVPAGTVFVLGDNRGNSVDSRDYGPIPADALLGRAEFRLWPVIRSSGSQTDEP